MSMVSKKAVAYIRVSSTGQVDGTGLDRQESAVREFAKVNKLDLVKIYRDEGISGTVEGFDRPRLALLASEIEEGVAIIVENADRLARDLLIQELIINEFKKYKIEIVDVSGNDLFAWMMIQAVSFFGRFSELLLNLIRPRLCNA
jgi:site-specific DNA recombinase